MNMFGADEADSDLEFRENKAQVNLQATIPHFCYMLSI